MDVFELLDGECRITFCDRSRAEDGWLDSFSVCIEEPGLRAAARVENSRYSQGPEAFFKELAENWAGWKGAKRWNALERELELSATTDALGHIVIEVLLRPSTCPEQWKIVTYAYTEAGQLELLRTRAERFFGRVL